MRLTLTRLGCRRVNYEVGTDGKTHIQSNKVVETLYFFGIAEVEFCDFTPKVVDVKEWMVAAVVFMLHQSSGVVDITPCCAVCKFMSLYVPPREIA